LGEAKRSNPKRAGRRREGLQDEIAMLRVIIRRMKSLADEDRPLPELLRLCETFGRLSTRLAQLLKAERALGGGSSDVQSALDEVLAEMIQELRDADAGKREPPVRLF